MYFLYDKLLEFFEQIDKENKLLTSVYWDLLVKQFKVGCRCLGLIHKLVTAPLWRKMEKEKTALNMSTFYQSMLSSFQNWASDSSVFVKGEVSLFDELVHRDEIFCKLVAPDPELDDSTIQLLEIIFNSFVVVSNRMLKDHLIGGKYDNPSEELIMEAKSTATTNAEAEQDFGMLDRLKKLKPKALDLTLEGMIMYQRNDTTSWRKKLPKNKWRKLLNLQENQRLLKRRNIISN